MAERKPILSEGEIAALVENEEQRRAQSADEHDDSYRVYDFRGREHSLLREFVTLRAVLEIHASTIASALGSAFSLKFNARSLPAQLVSVRDALEGIRRGSAVTSVDLTSLGGEMHVITQGPLLTQIVDAFFGGDKLQPGRVAAREHLTPAELRMAERVGSLVTRAMSQAWIEKVPIESGSSVTLESVQRLEALPGANMLLRMGFEISTGGRSYEITALLPFTLIEPYRQRFAAPVSATKSTKTSWEPLFRRELSSVVVEVTAVLTALPITLSELLGLSVGDTIPMPSPGSVDVCVNGVSIAEGRYGTYRGSKAVQIELLGAALLKAREHGGGGQNAPGAVEAADSGRLGNE